MPPVNPMDPVEPPYEPCKPLQLPRLSMTRNKNGSMTPLLGNDQPFFRVRFGDSRYPPFWVDLPRKLVPDSCWFSVGNDPLGIPLAGSFQFDTIFEGSDAETPGSLLPPEKGTKNATACLSWAPDEPEVRHFDTFHPPGGARLGRLLKRSLRPLRRSERKRSVASWSKEAAQGTLKKMVSEENLLQVLAQVFETGCDRTAGRGSAHHEITVLYVYIHIYIGHVCIYIYIITSCCIHVLSRRTK